MADKPYKPPQPGELNMTIRFEDPATGKIRHTTKDFSLREGWTPFGEHGFWMESRGGVDRLRDPTGMAYKMDTYKEHFSTLGPQPSFKSGTRDTSSIANRWAGSVDSYTSHLTGRAANPRQEPRAPFSQSWVGDTGPSLKGPKPFVAHTIVGASSSLTNFGTVHNSFPAPSVKHVQFGGHAISPGSGNSVASWEAFQRSMTISRGNPNDISLRALAADYAGGVMPVRRRDGSQLYAGASHLGGNSTRFSSFGGNPTRFVSFGSGGGVPGRSGGTVVSEGSSSGGGINWGSRAHDLVGFNARNAAARQIGGVGPDIRTTSDVFEGGFRNAPPASRPGVHQYRGTGGGSFAFVKDRYIENGTESFRFTDWANRADSHNRAARRTRSGSGLAQQDVSNFFHETFLGDYLKGRGGGSDVSHTRNPFGHADFSVPSAFLPANSSEVGISPRLGTNAKQSSDLSPSLEKTTKALDKLSKTAEYSSKVEAKRTKLVEKAVGISEGVMTKGIAGGMSGGMSGAPRVGGFFGQIGEQFRHAAIWQAYTPLIAGAGMAMAGYLGMNDYSDAAAQDLMGVNYNRAQRLEMKQKAMHAEATTPHLKAQDRLKLIKAVVSSNPYGTSQQDMADINYKAHEVSLFASQGDIDPVQAARFSSRFATMVQSKSKHVSGMSFNQIHTGVMGSMGATQASAVITAPEGVQYMNQAGAVMLNNGWKYQDIIARMATGHGAGVPTSKLGIFDRNVLGGQENIHMANAHMMYDKVKESVAASGGNLVASSLPDPKKLYKHLNTPEGKREQQIRALQAQQILQSGDPKLINEYLMKTARRIDYLSKHGYEAQKYTGKGMLPVWQEYANYSDSMKEKLQANTEAAYKGAEDPGYHQKMEDQKRAETPGATVSTTWGAVLNYLNNSSQRGLTSAKNEGRETPLSSFKKGTNSMESLGAIAEAYGTKDSKERDRLHNKALVENYDMYKSGHAERITTGDVRAAVGAKQVIDQLAPKWTRKWVPGFNMAAELLETGMAKGASWIRATGAMDAIDDAKRFLKRPKDDWINAIRPTRLDENGKVIPYTNSIYPESSRARDSSFPKQQETQSLHDYEYGDRSKGARYYHDNVKIPDFEPFDIPGVGSVGGPGSGKGNGGAGAGDVVGALGAVLAGAITQGFQAVTFAPVIHVNAEKGTAEQKQESPTNLPFSTPKDR